MRALADVRRAIPEATFIEAAPDLVGVPEIAKLSGVTRQYIGKVLKENEAEFPLPVHDGRRPLWHLETVLQWFAERNLREVDGALLDVARINRYCNYARDGSRLTSEVPPDLKAAVA